MRCGECGSKNIKIRNVAGKTFRWKDFSKVTLSQKLELNVCQECENVILLLADGEKLDTAIEASVFEQVRLAISAIKENQGCDQKDIAERLGISPEYLSEIKNGRQTPSFQLFNFLKTLALDRKAFEAAAPEVHIDFKIAMRA